MSLVTREVAVQNGASHNNDKPNDQRLQLAQSNGSLKSGDEMSREYKAPAASFSIPTQNGAADRRNDGLADFFSSEVFQIVLHNPATAHRLLKFSQARMCGENMEFLEKV